MSPSPRNGAIFALVFTSYRNSGNSAIVDELFSVFEKLRIGSEALLIDCLRRFATNFFHKMN